MNWYLVNFVLAHWLTSLLLAGLAVFVWLKSRLLQANRLFVAFSLSIAWWALFQGYLPVAPTPQLARLAAHAEHVGVVVISTLFLHFVFALVGRSYPRWLRLNYALSAFFFVMIFTPWLVAGVDASRGTRLPYMVEPGPLYLVMMSWFMVQTTQGVFELFRAYRYAAGVRRTQWKYLAWAALIGYVGGCGNYLYVYDLELPIFNPFGTYSVPMYAFITAYAMLKHRLLDIRVVVARTALALAVYTMVLGSPITLAVLGQPALRRVLGDAWWLVPVALYAILAVIGPFVYYRLQKRTEQKLLRGQRRSQRTIRTVSRGLTRIKELTALAELIVRLVYRFLRPVHATVFLWQPQRQQFEVVATFGPKALEKSLTLPRQHPVVAWLTRERRPLVVPRIVEDTVNQANHRRLLGDLRLRLHTLVVVPSLSRGELVGFLCLGERLSEEEYVREDIDVLATLADQAAIAFENARAYESLHHAKRKLVDQEKMAAIAHFASGMAHEIKNPLSTIRTFAEFLPKKYHDPAFRQKFAKLVTSEADRINAIVQQLLDFAKPVPPRLQPIDIQTIMDATLDWLSNDCLSAQAHVDRAYEADHRTVLGDPNQLRQVFLNLCLNSIEAMVPEQRFRRLTVETTRRRDEIIIRLKDNGCGIPPEHIPKLFDPFFTTKDRGTGLGLAVVQRIIEMHRGTIEVYSKVGEGTIVELRFPLAVALAPSEVPVTLEKRA